MRRKPEYVSLIVILLTLAPITYVATSVENGMNMQPNRIHTKFKAENDQWQSSARLPRRSEKAQVKRALELESSFSEIGRNIGGLAKNNNPKTLSDLTKDNNFADLGKGLRGQDNNRFDRANSFREDPRFNPVQTFSRSESLPISSAEAQKSRRLKLLEDLDTHYKTFDDLTDSFMKYDPDREFIDREFGTSLYAVKIGVYLQQEALKAEERPLIFEATLALYAEQRLFQSAIDGKSDAEVGQLAKQLEKQRSIYVDALKQSLGTEEGVEDKRFLNDLNVRRLQDQVIAIRKSIWAHTVSPSEIAVVKNDANGAKRVAFPENLSEDEQRRKVLEDVWEKSLPDITANAYLDLGSPPSSIEIYAPKDATFDKVKEKANEAQDAYMIFTRKTIENGEAKEVETAEKAAREARKTFQWYIQSYSREKGIDYRLFKDIQEISERRELRSGNKITLWFDRFKSKFRKLLSKFKSIFKKNKGRTSSSTVSPAPDASPQMV